MKTTEQIMVFIFGTFILIELVTADVYLHNPRGSNNRVNEDTRPRKNANNAFDSQNNQRGGYNNAPKMSYYQGSVLTIEWTNQHSCHNPNNECEVILQYTCGDKMADGKVTGTIPFDKCNGDNCNPGDKFRMHEDYDYYLGCKLRERNKGLFTADQNLKNRNTAINTRQDAAGTRYGYECPEERDYYPYWHPSPWKDIAVLTNNVSKCDYYHAQSQNVKSRWACVFSKNTMRALKTQKTVLPNNKKACEEFTLPNAVKVNEKKPQWKEFPAHGIPEPVCQETQYTRDNHLGNTLGGYAPTFNWTLPEDFSHDKCVLRIRYNISTDDYPGWSTFADYNAPKAGQATKVPMAARFGFESEKAAQDRGYKFEGNPDVKVFPGLNVDLEITVNTDQYGRVFQDRTHLFGILKRSNDLKDKEIVNLSVRGKRGNIVQVYPAVEYDFVPNHLEINKGAFVHAQWTGADTNPKNNAGEGTAGTDRNNMILIKAQVYPEGRGAVVYPEAKQGHYGNNYPMSINNATFLTLDEDDALGLAFVVAEKFKPGKGGNAQLNNVPAYFNLPPRKITLPGVYHYMCTRNNNFSNRDQKGRVVVSDAPFSSASIGYAGGSASLADGSASLGVPSGLFKDLTVVHLEQWSVEQGVQKLESMNQKVQVGDGYASNFTIVTPEDIDISKRGFMELEMNLLESRDKNKDVQAYHTDLDFKLWTRLSADVEDNKIKIPVRKGGVFVARTSEESSDDTTLIVAVVVIAIIVAAIFVGTFIYFKRRPTKYQAVTSCFRRTERSMKNKV